MIAGFCVVVFALCLPGQTAPVDSPSRRFEFVETHMGSDFQVVLYSADEATARRASRAAFERIAALDAALSDYSPESELMRLCDRAGGPPVAVSDDLFFILQRSKAMYERSGGAFDVTIGPVVRLWRRARRDHKLPAAETLAHARSLVSSDLMTLDPLARTVRLAKRGMKLDLGGIAKGYASNEAVKVLSQHGLTRVLVAGAGDISVGDPPPGRDGWTIAIAPLNSSSPEPARSLLLHNASVSTSGDTARYVEIDGKRYSHLVDPSTGLGVIDRSSVTVIAPDGITADSLDTTVYILGPDRGLTLITSTPGASALILRERDGKTQTLETPGFAAYARPVGPSSDRQEQRSKTP